MKKHFNEIRSDPFKSVITLLQAIISIWVTAIGCDNHYFFWPPNWSNIENDNRIDALIVLVGLVLFFCTIFGVTEKKIIATLLVLCGGISLALATLLLFHVIMSHFWFMGLNVIGELILFCLILIVAHYL